MKKYMNTQIDLTFLGKEVSLYGWVSRKRNLGGLIFIDLRDRSGLMQLVLHPDNADYEIAENLKSEDVIKVCGKVMERSNKNPNLQTGAIELLVSKLTVLNKAKDIPFEIKDDTTALEETRLKFRYLDLRREKMKNNLIMRHKITKATREYLDCQNFLEIETPILCKSTPEGARDYLVPSRISKGNFYALPQSPQISKQLLMVSGMERYYQIARCFRDEDLRADRQPEFTQIDMEMSFVEEEDVLTLTEGLLRKVMHDTIGYTLSDNIPRMTFLEAMDQYGSDKPDTRFDMKLQNISNLFADTDFQVFHTILKEGGMIKCIVVKEGAESYSRKKIDQLALFVKTYQADQLAWLKYSEHTFSGSIAKVLSESEKEDLIRQLQLAEGDLILLIAGQHHIVNTALGALRLKLGKELGLMDPNQYNFLWVVDFPVFEYNEEEKRYYAMHHPFTAPKDSDVEKLLTDPGNCFAKAYDIVLNGYELGGGSIRIHQEDVQNKMFQALGMTPDIIRSKFGYLVDAFQYGTPPHGGLAIGLERFTMLLCQTDNIKDVIAFPKTASATDLMVEAPSQVDYSQLTELGLKLNEK